jgi:hypothetical protein
MSKEGKQVCTEGLVSAYERQASTKGKQVSTGCWACACQELFEFLRVGSVG